MTAAELDTLLGDPADLDNPVGHRAVLASDERAEMLAEGERLLDGYCLNAEFVPAEYGGRFTRVDRLAEVLRAVWRRDSCLGLGYGFSSFLAAINIWTAGDERQRRAAARLLLANGRIAAAFHELAHGNDFARAECAARAGGEGWRVSGRKEIVTNIARAQAMVLFARTSDEPGSRGHSQFFLHRGDLPPYGIRDIPRFRSSGMRGVQLGGALFTDCPIPDGTLLGRAGQGMEIALRAYQVTRAVFPAISVGPLDTALRTALACALRRRIYGGAVADIPYVRATIARAYADLLAVDAFSTMAVRAVHLAPEAMGVYAPAAKYLSSGIVVNAVADLRSVLGAQSYLRDGPYGIFQKTARDLAPATFAHVSRAACLVMILPQLPLLARRSWLTGPPAPGTLFTPGADLPPLRLDLLTAGLPRADGVLNTLTDIHSDDPAVTRCAARLRAEVRALKQDCAALPPTDIGIDGSPAAFALADRYTVLLAAASALAVSRHGDLPSAALLGVLDRLLHRLGGEPVLTEKEREAAEQHLFHSAVRRFEDRRLFDLTARRVPG